MTNSYRLRNLPHQIDEGARPRPSLGRLEAVANIDETEVDRKKVMEAIGRDEVFRRLLPRGAKTWINLILLLLKRHPTPPVPAGRYSQQALP